MGRPKKNAQSPTFTVTVSDPVEGAPAPISIPSVFSVSPAFTVSGFEDRLDKTVFTGLGQFGVCTGNGSFCFLKRALTRDRTLRNLWDYTAHHPDWRSDCLVFFDHGIVMGLNDARVSDYAITIEDGVCMEVIRIHTRVTTLVSSNKE